MKRRILFIVVAIAIVICIAMSVLIVNTIGKRTKSDSVTSDSSSNVVTGVDSSSVTDVSIIDVSIIDVSIIDTESTIASGNGALSSFDTDSTEESSESTIQGSESVNPYHENELPILVD